MMSDQQVNDDQSGAKSGAASSASIVPAQKPDDTGWWTVGLIVLFAGAILVAIARDLPALSRLADPAYARGLITWLMVVSAIGLAFILVYQAFNQKPGTGDAPFRHAREVFTSLMGIVGTIVGFYFGSAEKASALLTLAEPTREGVVVSTVVVGGTPPYRFQVSSSDKTMVANQDKPQQTEAGWIRFNLTRIPTESSSITLTVYDSKDVKGSRTFEIRPDPKPEPKPARSVDSELPGAPTKPGASAPEKK
jgi:hypothetical protein